MFEWKRSDKVRKNDHERAIDLYSHASWQCSYACLDYWESWTYLPGSLPAKTVIHPTLWIP